MPFASKTGVLGDKGATPARPENRVWVLRSGPRDQLPEQPHGVFRGSQQGMEDGVRTGGGGSLGCVRLRVGVWVSSLCLGHGVPQGERHLHQLRADGRRRRVVGGLSSPAPPPLPLPAFLSPSAFLIRGLRCRVLSCV